VAASALAAALTIAFLAIGAGARPAFAVDRGAYSMDVLVDGVPLQEYEARGTSYIAALKGREYSVRLRNNTHERIAIALSVDGLNSIDATTTSMRDGRKWILGPYQTITIDGWQTSLDTSRRFFFTSEKKSYGEWLGNTTNLGIIAAAVFRERRPVPPPVCRGWRCPGNEPIEPLGIPGAGHEGWDGPADRDARLRAAQEGAGSAKGQTVRPASPPAPGAANDSSGTAAGPEAEALRESALDAPQESYEGEGGDDHRRDSSGGKEKDRRKLSDELAATGIGREREHRVVRVEFDEQDHAAAVIELRYEYRDALVKLGVLPPYPDGRALARRERARGFEDGGFAPDPYARRR